jgi:predicted AlkP superfamily phosphohydrolase/phosphomutase
MHNIANRAKLMIIGLDGGTFKIIDPLINDGKLPNLKKLIDGGTKATLRSTIPPVTAPAWVTLMTGVNPGKHGLFDFCKLKTIAYDISTNYAPKETCSIMHSQYYNGKTIWDIFGEMGLRSSVIMMPMTYPAWEINGYMLSGYPSPDFQTPTGYPLEWASKIGPLFDMSAISVNNEDKLIKECSELVRKVELIFMEQIKKNDCDVHCVVFSSTDFLQHYLWKYVSDVNSNYSTAIQNIYIQIDKAIGNFMKLVDRDKCTFVVISDHGFTSVQEKYFHANAWLIEQGYLSFKGKKLSDKITDLLLNPLRYQKVKLRLLLKSYFKFLPEALRKKVSDSYYGANLFEWSRSKAYRHRIGMMEGIVINLKGRQPLGIVEEHEYESLRDDIIRKLKDIVDGENGKKVIKEIYRREELFEGKFAKLVPDIILLTDSKYEIGVGTDNNAIFEYISEESKSAISGVHDMDGILILNGPKIKASNVIQHVGIIDVFPTIFYDLNLPMPKYVDGKIMRDAYKDGYASLPMTYTAKNEFSSKSHHDLTGEEQDAMREALKGLGYL